MGEARWAPWAAVAAVVAVIAAVPLVRLGLPGDGPPPLGLVSVAAGAGAEPALDSGTGGATGRYALTAELPVGPSSARVHRLAATAGTAEVARLAAALSLTGPIHRVDNRWEVLDGRRTLRVADTPGNPWTYARDPLTACLAVPGAGPDQAVSCTATAAPGVATGGTPPPAPPVAPTATAVRATADPVLRAAGLDPDTAAVTGGAPESTATVRADPTAAGLATAGWSTWVAVDRGGIVTVSGWLATTTRPGDDYPIIGAPEAFDRLAQRPVPLMACPEPAPTADRSALVPGCGDGPVTITGARLGLSLEQTAEGPLLVPAWLFSTAGSTDDVAVVAVQQEFWGTPEPSGGAATGSAGSTGPAGSAGGTEPEPGPAVSDPALTGPAVTPPTVTMPPVRGPVVMVQSARPSPDGRSLELMFYGQPDVTGPCGASYDAVARGSDTQVMVQVTEEVRTRPAAADVACPAIAAERRVSVDLDAPLGARTLVDATTGRAVPVSADRPVG